ncbi:integrase core domain protein, partial [Ancylostoma duodenale]
INGHPIQLLLDTGAEITIVSESKWKLLGKPLRQKTHVSGFAANGTPLKIRGCFDADFAVNNSAGGRCFGRGTCFVAEDDCNVLGMPWIKQLPDLYKAIKKYQIHRTIVVDHVATSRDTIVAKLKTKFANVFKPGLGRCTKTKATLMLGADAQPVFRRKRPVSYANVAALNEEIDRLLAEDVLSPVTYSRWAAPIVVVKKSNGTLRLCADFSTGLNDALMLHQHPLPTPDDVFTKLNGGTVFTQLDFPDAYLQVEVDENSKELLTINTHQGLFRYNRLPFGVKSAPGIFQQIIDSMIAGLNGCAAYLDDVIVTGRNIEEHTANLEALFQRIQEYGFRVRIEKCSFLMPQIRYLGSILDAKGRHPDPAKIEVIKKMPPPKDIGQTGEWPKKPKDRLLRFNFIRNSLMTQRGCLMFGDRIVIPDVLQAAVLQDLHDGHPGMARMKMLVRDYCYWTNIDKDIEDKVKSCIRCQECAQNPIKNTLCSWPIEDEPWIRVHADFAGPLEGRMFLVIVDACSKWPEIIEMSTTTSTATIQELRHIFARFGYPKTVVTDNGTQFTSREFSDFCCQNGIKHLRSPRSTRNPTGKPKDLLTLLREPSKSSEGRERHKKPYKSFCSTIVALLARPCLENSHPLKPSLEDVYAPR